MFQKAVMDMAVMELLCLEHLYLQVACPNGFQDHGFWLWRCDLETWISDWIPTYKPPASCWYLPRLSVGGRVNYFQTHFVGVRNPDMKWMYEETN